MKEIKQLRNLVEMLCKLNKVINHSSDECHFACTLDDADRKYASVMNYPCVVFDCGDILFNGGPETKLNRSVSLFFVDHVTDTGDEAEKLSIYENMEETALAFVAQILMLSKSYEAMSFLNRIDLDNTRMMKIEHEEQSLCGWALTFSSSQILRECYATTQFDKDDVLEQFDLLYRNVN